MRAARARFALAPALALLTACQDPPHDGVKLMPRTEPARPTELPVAADARLAGTRGTAGLRQPDRPATASPPAVRPDPAPPSATAPPQQGRLDPDTLPRLVMPGEPTGNDDFRQALRQKFERQP